MLIARRGSRVSVYRGTATTQSDGNRSLGSWTLVSSGTPMLIQPIGDALAQKVFGTAEVVRDRGFVAGSVSLEPTTDRILVTSGPRAGQRYRVEEIQSWDHDTRADHQEVALISTTESFP